MRQLADLDGDGRQALMERAEEACVVFPGATLPRGCAPSHARLGLEATTRGGALLHVERGCSYEGADTTVQNWVESGTAEFDTAESFWRWIDESDVPVDYAPPRVDLGAIEAPEEKRRHIPNEAALMSALSDEIFGQDRALEAVTAATARHIAQRFPMRPLSVMALGPTGTGKTATAESLARTLSRLTGGDYGVTRLDMVEFQESHTTARFFGSPPGYVGYRDGSALTDILAENPRCVIVIDEVEKAHRNVLVALMALMDTGRIGGGARSSGRSVDARQAILMFTSNLGADAFLEAVGDCSDPVEVDRLGRSHLRASGMAPEIVGRIHRVVGFDRLDSEARARVAIDMIGRCGRAYGLNVVEVDPKVISALLSAETDRPSGARTLGYQVDEQIGSLLAEGVRSGLEGDVAIDGEPTRLRILDADCSVDSENE